MTDNTLYYGDNLEVLRKYTRSNTVDLCYIDPPFNSKRTYNQIYNNMGTEDRAQSQAFVDTWTWDDRAIEGYQEILDNGAGRFTRQTIELIKGLNNILGKGSLLAYLISMTLRITEIQRVLKRTGSFYLHCDPTASHYLKLVLDAIFCSQGGEFKNELIWRRGHINTHTTSGQFPRNHDVVLCYSKSLEMRYTRQLKPYSANTLKMYRFDDNDGRGKYRLQSIRTYGADTIAQMRADNRIVDTPSGPNFKQYFSDKEGVVMDDVWEDIPSLQGNSSERLGYQTQKPEALLERIIKSSSGDGDVVLDAYCGCGTTVAVAQALGGRWIGIDITYQSIALVLRRLEAKFGKDAVDRIKLDGIPRDMASAQALANKRDDRVRKEFEKWAVMTYTGNRAVINQKKGADAGIDGVAYFRTTNTDNAKIILQVKSGGVGRGDIATLRGDMQRESAEMAVLITLQPPTAPMNAEAKAAGQYYHTLMGRNYDAISIVTIQDMIENGKVLDIPMSLEVLRTAQLKAAGNQLSLMDDPT